MFQRFSSETKSFLREAIELSYWSRGGVSYHDVFDMTAVERDEWHDWLKIRLEKEMNRPHPNY